MSHSAMSSAEWARLKMPPGPAEPAAARSFCCDRLDAQRILADHQRSELVDRTRRVPVSAPPK